MTKIFLRSVVWEENTTEHIKKHGVRKVEVESAIEGVLAHRRGYKQRIILIGKSGTRLISVVVFKEARDRFIVVTARDADKKERRLVYEKEKNK